jgi:hypothetical protein
MKANDDRPRDVRATLRIRVDARAADSGTAVLRPRLRTTISGTSGDQQSIA